MHLWRVDPVKIDRALSRRQIRLLRCRSSVARENPISRELTGLI